VSSSPLIAAHEVLFAKLRLTCPELFADCAQRTGNAAYTETIESPEASDDVLFAVSKLDEPARHIMLLQLVNALSIDAIADKLRVPRATVVGTLSVAHERIKRYVGMCG
jgi:DNA-directed RNA polymerase specialized sigma24 family protein